jgi:hypothetical protein
MTKYEKVNIVETPKSWDDIVTFCNGASTPSDATIAALMAWNMCVEFHHNNDTCCEELRKMRARGDEPLLTPEERDALMTEVNNDGC